jgi:hypothetical protein
VTDPGRGSSGLWKREVAWWREPSLPVWDRTGGPGRFGGWRHAHPVAAHGGILVVGGGLLVLLSTLASSPLPAGRNRSRTAAWVALALLGLVS